MLSKRLKSIRSVLQSFTGEEGEPNRKSKTERYLLKAMWVMLLSEFEGCLKENIDQYIDKIKKIKSIKDMHICFLVQSAYGNQDKKFTLDEILKLYNGKKKDIGKKNFTKDKKPRYKFDQVIQLFGCLGIFFNEKEKTEIRLLDGIASTRDSIAHGDYGISITRKQLEDNIKTIKKIFNILKGKLK